MARETVKIGNIRLHRHHGTVEFVKCPNCGLLNPESDTAKKHRKLRDCPSNSHKTLDKFQREFGEPELRIEQKQAQNLSLLGGGR